MNLQTKELEALIRRLKSSSKVWFSLLNINCFHRLGAEIKKCLWTSTVGIDFSVHASRENKLNIH